MPTKLRDLYEEITYNLGNLKTSKNEDQVIINNLLKRVHCLSYNVCNINIDMDFLKKFEFIKQFRQPVLNCGNKDFFLPIVQKFQRLKIMAMVVVYEKNPEVCYGWSYKN